MSEAEAAAELVKLSPRDIELVAAAGLELPGELEASRPDRNTLEDFIHSHDFDFEDASGTKLPAPEHAGMRANLFNKTTVLAQEDRSTRDSAFVDTLRGSYGLAEEEIEAYLADGRARKQAELDPHRSEPFKDVKEYRDHIADQAAEQDAEITETELPSGLRDRLRQWVANFRSSRKTPPTEPGQES